MINTSTDGRTVSRQASLKQNAAVKSSIYRKKRFAPPRLPGEGRGLLTQTERNKQNPDKVLSHHGGNCHHVYQYGVYHCFYTA